MTNPNQMLGRESLSTTDRVVSLFNGAKDKAANIYGSNPDKCQSCVMKQPGIVIDTLKGGIDGFITIDGVEKPDGQPPMFRISSLIEALGAAQFGRRNNVVLSYAWDKDRYDLGPMTVSVARDLLLGTLRVAGVNEFEMGGVLRRIRGAETGIIDERVRPAGHIIAAEASRMIESQNVLVRAVKRLINMQ